MTETVRSTDGTTIAFDRSGDGPALVLVVGAFCDRSSTASLARRLAPHFTVYEYDRRGRGSSGDTAPYSVDREIDDLEAVLAASGGSALVYGHSSGAVLALSAAARGVPITRLVAYEPPFIVDDSRPRPAADLADRLRMLVAAGRRGDAVARFLVEGVDIPAPAVASMRAQPTWADREAFAPTLVYELAVCGPGQSIPVDEMARIRIPTLVLDGGASPEWARRSVAAVAAAIPGARHQTLDGQDHGVADEVLAPLLVEYLT